MSKIRVVVGGQYGSEAKGHVAGFLSRKTETSTPNVVAVRVAGPNAGHSVVDQSNGIKYALRQVPVAAVTNPHATLVIAAGSEVDAEVLSEEIETLEGGGITVRDRLFIDSAATHLQQNHIEAERVHLMTEKIGSTSKGIGAARAARAMRQARTVGQERMLFKEFGNVANTGSILREYLDTDDAIVQIEGTQGFGLGLHQSAYPQVTSSDCTAIDFLAMAGISPWFFGHHQPFAPDLEIWVVFRPLPIRVAGNSGPLHQETTWEALGLEPEYTTVTKKMRRVGRWDPHLAALALAANGHPSPNVWVALTMADQIDPALAGTIDPSKLAASGPYRKFLTKSLDKLGVKPALVTTSDRTVVDLRGFGDGYTA